MHLLKSKPKNLNWDKQFQPWALNSNNYVLLTNVVSSKLLL